MTSFAQWVQDVGPWVAGAGGLTGGGGLAFYGLSRREKKADITEKIQRAAGALVDDLMTQVADMRAQQRAQAVEIAELRARLNVMHDYTFAAATWQTQVLALVAAHDLQVPAPPRPPTVDLTKE